VRRRDLITAPTQVRGDLTGRPAFLSGGGGLNSTTEDYFRFSQMLLDGGEANGRRLLKRSTVERMYANVLEPGVTIGRTPGLGFGMDFAIVLDPTAADTPEGKNTYYWGGAFGTWFWIDPTNDVIVVGMIQNTNGSQATSGTPQVRPLSRRLVYQALVDPRK
jgi:CubicO group peptidase (beta-lactamase class C family)